MAESQQTLTLLRMVKQYPEDSERKTALRLQWQRENRLRLGYEERRAELLRLISGQKPEQQCSLTAHSFRFFKYSRNGPPRSCLCSANSTVAFRKPTWPPASY